MARASRPASSSPDCNRCRVSKRSTNQSIVFWRLSTSRWAGSETTMRPPTHLASDVFLRRLLMRISTSGATVVAPASGCTGAAWGSSRVGGIRSRGSCAGGSEGGGDPVVGRGRGSVSMRWATSNRVTPGIVADECGRVMYACSASLHRGVQGVYDAKARQRDRAEREARMSALLLATNGGTEAILVIVYIAVVVLEIA